ncbi:hypothetical protein EYF80_002390 [Liparis tanakae]|uniref:Uncharacterized protein n=1 Tax=Liparis tanakae TaxID=230148 RepID=A0A4Z2JC27_9TELE|nr:hypothetical protein EYF80_002390 [Liparis tanakae]
MAAGRSPYSTQRALHTESTAHREHRGVVPAEARLLSYSITSIRNTQLLGFEVRSEGSDYRAELIVKAKWGFTTSGVVLIDELGSLGEERSATLEAVLCRGPYIFSSWQPGRYGVGVRVGGVKAVVGAYAFGESAKVQD